MTPSVSSQALAHEVPELNATDVRQKVDEAVRRGWTELARRVGRVSVLMTLDVLVVYAIARLLSPGLTAPGGWALFLLALCIQPLALHFSGAYRVGEGRVSYVRILQGLLLTAFVAGAQGSLAGGRFLDASFDPMPLLAYLTWGSISIFLIHKLVDRAVVAAYRSGIGQRNVLVVGSAAEMRGITEMLRDRNGADLRLLGRLSARRGPDPGAIAGIAELSRILRETDVREVVIATNISFEVLETLVSTCFEHGVVVSVAPRTLHLVGMHLELRRAREGVLIRLQPQGLGFPQLAVKRAIDLVLSVVALVVLWPLFGLIALAIKIDSPGPVLFRQTRAGLGGRAFSMFKFRTMVDKADGIKTQLLHLNESGDPRLFKIRDDPRVTRIGRFLRRTSFDELPQLFNVLKGEMSLIGPRPFFPEDLAGYDRHHLERLSVLPGITGWWQVKGRSTVVDFEEVVRLDREYIDAWSVWFDLKILLLTLPTILRRTGAF